MHYIFSPARHLLSIGLFCTFCAGVLSLIFATNVFAATTAAYSQHTGHVNSAPAHSSVINHIQGKTPRRRTTTIHTTYHPSIRSSGSTGLSGLWITIGIIALLISIGVAIHRVRNGGSWWTSSSSSSSWWTSSSGSSSSFWDSSSSSSSDWGGGGSSDFGSSDSGGGASGDF